MGEWVNGWMDGCYCVYYCLVLKYLELGNKTVQCRNPSGVFVSAAPTSSAPFGLQVGHRTSWKPCDLSSVVLLIFYT